MILYCARENHSSAIFLNEAIDMALLLNAVVLANRRFICKMALSE